MTERYDVAIVGGGPAGQAAALQVLAAGLSTCMIDEQQRPGGQILRQPPRELSYGGWMQGGLYRNLREQLARIEADPRLDWIGGTSVLGLARESASEGGGFTLSLSGARTRELRARRVLVAAGCYDMPVALPGWTLPGAMSVGAVQTLLKAQGVLPGQRFALFGTHPLMFVLAEQLVEAGAQVAAVTFAQGFGTMARLALPHVPAASATPTPLLAALRSWRKLRKAGVPIHYGAPVARVAGDGARVNGIELADGRAIACDVAAMCYGFLPQSDLPRAAGAQVVWSDPAGGWETRHDAWMRASLPGLYVAGETTGVTGADAAVAEGGIAGLAMASDAGAIDARTATREHGLLTSRRRELDGFIALLRSVADPRPWLPQSDPQTLICRCEDVDAATVDGAIAQALQVGSSFGASAIKLRCRAGMGLCQGRSCEHALVRRIAAAQGRPAGEVAGFRARFPARPVPIDELLGP
ncbi:MAG: FAD-dependent oxidoreductase [Sphingomonadales bacterium]|nr:MAG: FAD-dependent oxidoreductase [Sphingomonadales bacterium]